MAAIVRASSLQLVSHPLKLNISSRKTFAPAPVAPRKVGVATDATLRARNAVVVSAFSSSTVQMIIQGRNLSVTPAIKEYVESKVGKVSSHHHPTPALGLSNFCHDLDLPIMMMTLLFFCFF
jgi:Sigma 54 modulation protein / S30EA ribosomal protein